MKLRISKDGPTALWPRLLRAIAQSPVIALLLLCAPVVVNAQTTYGEESAQRIRAAERVAPLGDTMFGEQISLYNGTTKFRVVDASLPSHNGLKVEFARNIGGFDLSYNFFGVDIDVPKITTIMPRSWSAGWTPDPPEVAYNPEGVAFEKKHYWQGFRLTTSSGTENLLYRGTDTRISLPAMPGDFRFMTKSGWALETVPAASGVGSTVIGHAPDGTKYYFDHLSVYTYYGNVQHPTAFKIVPWDAGSAGSGANVYPATLDRQMLTLFVSKIEDRFGNWVKYDWAGGKLLRIYANDGRQITITSDKLDPGLTDAEDNAYVLKQISVNGRVWKYNGGEVVNPDGSSWSSASVIPTYIDYQRSVSVFENGVTYQKSLLHDIIPCSKGYDFKPGQQRVFTIKHPSGALASYEFVVMRHGRTNVPATCFQRSDDPEQWNNPRSTFDDVWSLVKKTVSGPGLATQTTTYAYEGLNPAVAQDDAGVPLPTPNYKTVTVTDSDGSFRKLIFGRDWGLNEGTLLSTREYTAQGVLLRQTDNAYLTPADIATQPFPPAVGGSGVAFGDNFASQNLPLRSRVIQQDGATFTSYVEAYDKFASPARVRRYSSLGFSATDSTEYESNLSLWILSQVKRRTNVNSNLVMSQVDYDPASALPIRTYAFGKLQQTLTYNLAPGPEAGALATVKDGNNNVTTLSSWKRGVPQTLAHADATTESAVVNDDGTIASAKDENGYKTCYTYDLMGRLASIVYPSETVVGACDTATWNSTTMTFAPFTTTAEYGIPAGHWKQTISTGNARKVTYLDALWRPLVQESYDYANAASTRSVSVQRYDLGGHPAYQSYPLSTLSSYATVTQGTRSTYDGLDRVTRVEQDSELGILASTSVYQSGFKTLVTNPRGFQTTTSYLAYDQPTTDWPVTITHPEGAITDIGRDVFGKPLNLTRRNADNSSWIRRYFAYDAYQQLCKRTELETGNTFMAYDAAGNLAWSVAGLPWSSSTSCAADSAAAYASGRRVDRTYDPRNRVKTLSFPDGLGNQTLTYTLDGLADTITTYNGANNTVPVINAYHYSKRRMLDGQGESVEQTGWYTWGLGYGYDANGSLSVNTYPSGLSVTYAPNALGQSTQAGTYATAVSYFPNGAIKQFNYGNGIVHTLTQNTRQLPDRSRDVYGASPAVLDDSYDYDANVNVAAISDGLAGARGNRTMTYDGLDRLKTTTAPVMFNGTVATYSYDVLDNLKTVKAPGRDHSYVYDANLRLTNVTNTVGGASVIGLGYDVQGNLANKNGVLYAFDYGNRLRTVTGQESYRYDGLGRRVLAWSPTLGNILSQYSRDGKLMIQSNVRIGKVIDQIYLGGSLVAQREVPIGGGTATVKYQHTDALGSPVAVTNSSRTVLERSEYEPFGKLTNRTLTDGPGFTGHVSDAATGMINMQQRYYDPGIGRFLSVDPVTADGNTGSNFNRYWYANNNPYKFTDPDGRAPQANTCSLLGGRSCSGTYEGSGVGPPSVRAGDNAPRSGNSHPSSVNRLFMLPQNQGEGGFYNYGTPPNGAGQYGTGSALSAIFKVGHQRTLDGETKSFGVGNISLKGGRPFAPHSSHRNGVDIDIRPMNVDGAQRGGVTWRSAIYDRSATQQLVDGFYATGQVRVIYFNDPQLRGVQPMRDHDDHLHVGVSP